MLDTNICIYLIKQHPPQVAARFRELRVGDVVMSAITYAELRYGVEAMRERRDAAHGALEALIADIPVLPFGADAAVAYGVIRAAVRDRKRDALDRLIAAHAVSHSLILVTNNTADFDAYPQLEVQNWVA